MLACQSSRRISRRALLSWLNSSRLEVLVILVETAKIYTFLITLLCDFDNEWFQVSEKFDRGEEDVSGTNCNFSWATGLLCNVHLATRLGGASTAKTVLLVVFTSIVASNGHRFLGKLALVRTQGTILTSNRGSLEFNGLSKRWIVDRATLRQARVTDLKYVDDPEYLDFFGIFFANGTSFSPSLYHQHATLLMSE